MVPVEAQAAGRPVIAYRAGGAVETVAEDRSGIFFNRQDVNGVAEAIERFESADSLWSPQEIQTHAAQFSMDRFRERFTSFYAWCAENYTIGGAQRVRAAMETIDPEAFL